MTLHWVANETLTATNYSEPTTYLLIELQQYLEEHDVQEVQLWAFVHKNGCGQREQLETKIEKQLSFLLGRPVECILIQETLSFEEVLLEVDRAMHWLSMHEPFCKMGLALTANGLLQQAVLIEGVKTFEERFFSIYKNFTQQYNETPLQQSWLQLLLFTLC